MGCHLSSPNKTKSFEENGSSRMKYIVASMQGWRIEMEDAHIAYQDEAKDLYIFGVFDGHGGKEVAKFAKKYFVEELIINPSFIAQDYKKALTETFYRMDELLLLPEKDQELKSLKYDEGEEKDEFFDEPSTAGCTANVVLIVGDTLYVANAGDSRSVLSHSGGVIKELSKDHKPDDDIERDRIKKVGGEVTNGRVNGNLSLSRAFGDFDYKKNKDFDKENQLIIATPDIEIMKIDGKFEFILLGCDGIWETKKSEEIMSIVRVDLEKRKAMKDIAENLLETLIAPNMEGPNGYGLDNMTCIIVVFNQKAKEEESKNEEKESENIKKVEMKEIKEENHEGAEVEEVKMTDKEELKMPEKKEVGSENKKESVEEEKKIE